MNLWMLKFMKRNLRFHSHNRIKRNLWEFFEEPDSSSRSMANPSNLELLKKLETKIDRQDKEIKERILREEKLRCQNLTLVELQQEKMEKGKHQGKTCQEIYEEDAGYLVWLLQHQENNPQFQKLFELGRRMERVAPAHISPEQEAIPRTSQGYLSRIEMPSGEMLLQSPSGSEWEEMPTVGRKGSRDHSG